MNATVTYTGPLASGYVQCPKTVRSYPFKNGVPFSIPEDLAVNLAFQSPNDWSVDAAVKKMANDKSAISVVIAPPSEVETANTEETTEEKV